MTTDPQAPARLADAAAEAVRSLNHATLSRRAAGWEYPGDAYSTVASLSAMAAMLPQALGQIEGFIGALGDADRLRSDKGPEDLPGRLTEFHDAMGAASRQARALYVALNQAHQLLGPVAYKE